MDPTALGENLMNNLVSPQVRVGQKGCPVVFVCHSLGGLIVKEIVVGAANSANKDLQNLVKNIKAFFFYATPHQGSRLVEFGMMTKHLHVGLSDSVEYLQVLDKKRTRMDAKFHEQANKFNNEWKFYVVAETKETKVVSFAMTPPCIKDSKFPSFVIMNHHKPLNVYTSTPIILIESHRGSILNWCLLRHLQSCTFHVLLSFILIWKGQILSWINNKYIIRLNVVKLAYKKY